MQVRIFNEPKHRKSSYITNTFKLLYYTITTYKICNRLNNIISNVYASMENVPKNEN